MTNALLAQEGVTPLLSLKPRRRSDASVLDASQADAPQQRAAEERTVLGALGPVSQMWMTSAEDFARALTDATDTCVSVLRDVSTVVRVASRSVLGAYATERIATPVDRIYDVFVVVTDQTSDVDAAVSIPSSSGRLSAVEAVLELATRLDVSEKTIYTSAGISPRTFKHWKRKPQTTPREGSVGGLWSIVSALDDLERFLGPDQSPAAWVKARAERMVALKEGRFRRLVDDTTGAFTVDPASTSYVASLTYSEAPEDFPLATGDNATHAHVIDGDGPIEVVTD